ncbi:hypothetical protein NQ318_005853 [Aromia moschata]|uniref:Chitin-binding type-2 domain-containing protein n=1 Tax=Aromia moschata TaxID=1265417 RepID=A0AAV8YT74_9CUCU|nr:hypothetical protein NQ318_005853 [Aromia moschata]
MKSTVYIAISFCVLVCGTDAVPSVFEKTWRILRTNGATESKCPPQAAEHPHSTNIPHETDCERFYICQKGKRIPMTCPSPFEFNAKTEACDWPQHANCALKKKTVADFQTTTTQTTPVGKRKLECAEEDRHTAHETNCDEYYRCVYGSKVLKVCPDNMAFDVASGYCDFTYNVDCGDRTLSRAEKKRHAQLDFLDDYSEGGDGNKETRNNEDYTYYDDFLNEDFDESPVGGEQISHECPEITDFYDEPRLLPHETNCNAYYRCSGGRKQLMMCPGVFQFDSKLSVCDWPRNVRCDKRKDARTTTTSRPPTGCPKTRCQDSTVYLPDPEDINRFVRCVNGKEIRESCPKGLVFDVVRRVCNWPQLAETVLKY